MKDLHFTRPGNPYYILTCLVVLWLVSFPSYQRAVSAQDREEVIRSIADETNREINEKTGIKDGIQQEALQVADFWRLRSADEIDGRIREMEKLSRAAGDVVAILRAGPARAYLKARSKGLSPEDAEDALEAIKSALESANATPIVRKMQTDREWARLHIEIFELLKKERGRWKPATGDGFIDVDKEGAFIEKLIHLTEEIKKVEDRADNIDLR